MKLRRNQMKLRKNHLISPKNFAIPSGENQIYPPRDLKIGRDCYEFAQFIL